MSPEAFELGKKLNIPTFGICHFTWDWFFNQVFPPIIPINIIRNWYKYHRKATKIFFPPFDAIELFTNVSKSRKN